MGFRGGFWVGGFRVLARCLRLFSGSLNVCWKKRPFVGVVPAWAGEPKLPFASTSIIWVYPRVGGGTSDRSTPTSPTANPRMRGDGSPCQLVGPAPAPWQLGSVAPRL